MAGWQPIVNIYDTGRRQWYGPEDIFFKGDYLPKKYPTLFTETDGSPTVPEVKTEPTPPPPSQGGGSPDPRVDDILSRLGKLESQPPGGGPAPDLSGIEGRLGKLEKLGLAETVKTVAGFEAKLTVVENKASSAEVIANSLDTKVGQVEQTANIARQYAENASRDAGKINTLQVGLGEGPPTEIVPSGEQDITFLTTQGNIMFWLYPGNGTTQSPPAGNHIVRLNNQDGSQTNMILDYRTGHLGWTNGRNLYIRNGNGWASCDNTIVNAGTSSIKLAVFKAIPDPYA